MAASNVAMPVRASSNGKKSNSEKNGKGSSISKSLHDRLITYARANASLGINGSVLNNVNASPKMYDIQNILIR